MLIHSASQVLTLQGGPQRGKELGRLGIVENGAVLLRDGKIAAVGGNAECQILRDRCRRLRRLIANRRTCARHESNSSRADCFNKKLLNISGAGRAWSAICHGVLVPARAVDAQTGQSVLYDYKVTALTKPLERIGYALTFWLFGRRFRTYEMYVEDEVREALRFPGQFTRGTIPFPHVEVDRNLVTSRYWLLDALKYSIKFAEMVEARLA